MFIYQRRSSEQLWPAWHGGQRCFMREGKSLLEPRGCAVAPGARQVTGARRQPRRSRLCFVLLMYRLKRGQKGSCAAGETLGAWPGVYIYLYQGTDKKKLWVTVFGSLLFLPWHQQETRISARVS